MFCAKDNSLTVKTYFLRSIFFSYSAFQFAFGPKMTISLSKNNSFFHFGAISIFLTQAHPHKRRKHYLQSKINETLLDYNLPKNLGSPSNTTQRIFSGGTQSRPPPCLCLLNGRFFCQISAEQNLCKFCPGKISLKRTKNGVVVLKKV